MNLGIVAEGFKVTDAFNCVVNCFPVEDLPLAKLEVETVTLCKELFKDLPLNFPHQVHVDFLQVL